MGRQQLDEIVREVEKSRPSWVVIRGKKSTGRTTLARRLCIVALQEYWDTRHERVPLTPGQVFWYSRDDQFSYNTRNAHQQLELMVKEGAAVNLPQVPFACVPKRYEGVSAQKDVIGANIIAAVFDDIYPGRVVCETVHRRVLSRGHGMLITTMLTPRIQTSDVSWLEDKGRYEEPYPWTVFELIG